MPAIRQQSPGDTAQESGWWMPHCRIWELTGGKEQAPPREGALESGQGMRTCAAAA